MKPQSTTFIMDHPVFKLTVSNFMGNSVGPKGFIWSLQYIEAPTPQ